MFEWAAVVRDMEIDRRYRVVYLLAFDFLAWGADWSVGAGVPAERVVRVGGRA